MPDIVRGNLPTQIPVQRQTPIMRGVAYDSTTSPTGRKGHTMSMKNTVNGASTGASFGGGYGALIGAAIGLGTDLYQLRYSKKAAERANEESRRAAAEQAARSEAAANAARQWSSEQATIRRLRMVGLSPGLAYGSMSPSAAQASPAVQQVSKADTPKIDNESLLRALQIYINQQNADTASAAQASNAQLQGSQTLLNAIDSLTRGQENNARISSILASKEYTDTQKLNLIAMLIPEQQNLLANARKANADAAVIEKTGVDLANSEIALNAAKIATEKERPYEIRQNIETSGDLATYYRRQSAILSQQYGIKQNKIDAVAAFLDEKGFSRDYLGFALDFCDDMAQHVGSDISKQSISTLFSWLDGRSWLNYIGSRLNTRDINLNRSNISENQIQSNERIAAGHDATRLESIDSYFEHAARSHDVEIRKEFNKYRSEYHLLNKANKKRIDELSAYYESKGYDADRIAQELGYLTHQLYLSQTR